MPDTARTRDTDPGGASPRHSGTPIPARTSGTAVACLVVGLIALLAALTGLLAPVAVVLGLIGVVLGVLGIRAARPTMVTGRSVAIGGLVLSTLALLLGIAALVGVATVVSNNPQILDQVRNLVASAGGTIPGA